MSAAEIRVKLVVDWSGFKGSMGKAILAIRGFDEALRRVARATGAAGRLLERLENTLGDDHIERVMREIATGVPGRDPVVRLIAASDFAAVLDASAR